MRVSVAARKEDTAAARVRRISGCAIRRAIGHDGDATATRWIAAEKRQFGQAGEPATSHAALFPGTGRQNLSFGAEPLAKGCARLKVWNAWQRACDQERGRGTLGSGCQTRKRVRGTGCTARSSLWSTGMGRRTIGRRTIAARTIAGRIIPGRNRGSVSRYPPGTAWANASRTPRRE